MDARLNFITPEYMIHEILYENMEMKDNRAG
jgi:hypothetical protein